MKKNVLLLLTLTTLQAFSNKPESSVTNTAQKLSPSNLFENNQTFNPQEKTKKNQENGNATENKTKTAQNEKLGHQELDDKVRNSDIKMKQTLEIMHDDPNQEAKAKKFNANWEEYKKHCANDSKKNNNCNELYEAISEFIYYCQRYNCHPDAQKNLHEAVQQIFTYQITNSRASEEGKRIALTCFIPKPSTVPTFEPHPEDKRLGIFKIMYQKGYSASYKGGSDCFNLIRSLAPAIQSNEPRCVKDVYEHILELLYDKMPENEKALLVEKFDEQILAYQKDLEHKKPRNNHPQYIENDPRQDAEATVFNQTWTFFKKNCINSELPNNKACNKILESLDNYTRTMPIDSPIIKESSKELETFRLDQLVKNSRLSDQQKATILECFYTTPYDHLCARIDGTNKMLYKGGTKCFELMKSFWEFKIQHSHVFENYPSYIHEQVIKFIVENIRTKRSD